MSSGDARKIVGHSLPDLAVAIELSEDARPLATEEVGPKRFLTLLMEKKLFADAARFMAFALPKRQAVWWSCLCAREGYGATVTPVEKEAIMTAIRWVVDPSEENRRATFPAAEAADFGSAAGCTALGAFFSGGSLAPEGVADVIPDEMLTGRILVPAITLSSVIREPEKADAKLESFVKLACDVASGQNHWPEKFPARAAAGGPPA